MSKVNYSNMEACESFEQQNQLNELYYNCIECPSPIEIISINENESNIEFKCIKNNHKIKISIKEYINKMKKFNGKNINDDICIIHNKIYKCYCFDCKIHICEECLKSRSHIGHIKNHILEYQPNKKELNSIEDIFFYYETRIEDLEKEKLNKTKNLNNKYTQYKKKLNEINEFKIKKE